MTDQSQVRMFISAGGLYYAIFDGKREHGVWLSIKKYPLPVPVEWHRPGTNAAFVMRGRDYYRLGTIVPQPSNGEKAISADDELVIDYREAVWWTVGLEEAWAEIQGLNEALCEATKLRVDPFHTPRSGPNAPVQGKPNRG